MAGGGGNTNEPAASVAAAEDLPLLTIDGASLGTLAKPNKDGWLALFFVGTDCPVSNRYAPEIKRICAEYEPKGVSCALVYSDSHFTVDDIRAHLTDFGYHLPAIFDRERRLVAQAGATITPEVAVYAPGGELAYRGRIDDQHAQISRPRQQATEQDLRDALDDLAAGRSVRNPRTQATGCYIE